MTSPLDPVALLQDLVAIPSVNPMGRDVSGPEYFEGRLTDYLLQFFRQLDVPHLAIEVQPGRSNVLARFDSPGSPTTILLDAHQDTVPVDGMTIPPFRPEIRDGKLYGRGSCDVKGGMAAMLAAFARLVKERPRNTPSVLMSCTCDEECTASGAIDLARLWSDERRRAEVPQIRTLLPAPPTAAIVAEPTKLDIVVAHRGAVRWKLRTTGRACHSSRPQDGVNAVYKMAPILTAIAEYAQLLPTLVPPHPLCGGATISVGLIRGGISVNTVPDECDIEIDRRCIPGENPATIIPDLTAYLHNRGLTEFEMLPPWVDGATLSDRNNGPIADQLMRHVIATVGPRQKIGVPYGTNGSRFAFTGVPTIVFGPGDIAQAHTVDEWIDLAELQQATDIYYRLCATPH